MDETSKSSPAKSQAIKRQFFESLAQNEPGTLNLAKQFGEKLANNIQKVRSSEHMKTPQKVLLDEEPRVDPSEVANVVYNDPDFDNWFATLGFFSDLESNICQDTYLNPDTLVPSIPSVNNVSIQPSVKSVIPMSNLHSLALSARSSIDNRMNNSLNTSFSHVRNLNDEIKAVPVPDCISTASLPIASTSIQPALQGAFILSADEWNQILSACCLSQ
jgi:hypothetical protein